MHTRQARTSHRIADSGRISNQGRMMRALGEAWRHSSVSRVQGGHPGTRAHAARDTDPLWDLRLAISKARADGTETSKDLPSPPPHPTPRLNVAHALSCVLHKCWELNPGPHTCVAGHALSCVLHKCWELNSGPYTRVTGTLPTELRP